MRSMAIENISFNYVPSTSISLSLSLSLCITRELCRQWVMRETLKVSELMRYVAQKDINNIASLFYLTSIICHPQYLLTPLNSVVLNKLTVSQLVNKFPAFYGTRRFITAFTSARHLSLSWARSIYSMLPHATYWSSILILSSHLSLGLPSGLYLSDFPTKTLCTPLLSPIRATYPAHLIFLDLITRTILGEQYRSFKLLIT